MIAQESPHYNLVTIRCGGEIIFEVGYYIQCDHGTYSDLNVTDGQTDGHCGKNEETNYRRYYRYHRYFNSKIPVYGPSLLTSHMASILETT